MGLDDLLCETAATCDFHQWGGARYMIFTHYASWWAQIILYTASALRNDVTLLVFGWGLTEDMLLSMALVYLFRVRAPQDTCGDFAVWCSKGGGGARPCTYVNPWEWLPFMSSENPDADLYGDCVPCGVPNFQVQHATFFATLVLLYTFKWYKPKIRAWHRGALVLYTLVVSTNEIFFGFTTPAQALVSNLVGFAHAALYLSIVTRYAYPYFDAFVSWRVFKWLGLDYENTLAADIDDPGVDYGGAAPPVKR